MFEDGARDVVNNKRLRHNNIYFVLSIKDGKASISWRVKTVKTNVGGVYSNTRGEGQMSADHARTWLQNTLGFSEDQILVTNGVMRGIQDQTVYGVTNLACSAICEDIFGFITLSRQAGKGVEYHEAWHYVNLLLHNRKRRIKIYQEYQKQHPELKNASMKEIEEAMAEDFKSYMIGIENEGFSARIKRFFKNMKELIKTFVGKQDVVYQAYERIRRGKYAKAEMDKASVEEFKVNFPGGVFFEIPGLTENQTSKFKAINNYHQYYKCAKMLCNMMLDGLDLSSVDKVKNLSS